MADQHTPRERGILFNSDMVRALLDGTKTQTRRIAKPARHPDLGNVYAAGALVLEREPQHVINRCCPFGQPGDRLWVRETWMPGYDHEADHEDGPRVSLLYRADNAERHVTSPTYEMAEKWERDFSEDGDEPPPWRPSIHMPRWASRITLEIVGVRVERLQGISETDAEAEGVNFLRRVPDADETLTARQLYEVLWDSINGPGSWETNPWLWAVEFKRVEADHG